MTTRMTAAATTVSIGLSSKLWPSPANENSGIKRVNITATNRKRWEPRVIAQLAKHQPNHRHQERDND